MAPWPPWWNGVVDFLLTAMGNLWREACYGGTIGYNDVFIWRNFGLPSSISDNAGHVVNKQKFANLCLFVCVHDVEILSYCFCCLNVGLLFVGVGIDMGSLGFIHIQFTANNYSRGWCAVRFKRWEKMGC